MTAPDANDDTALIQMESFAHSVGPPALPLGRRNSMRPLKLLLSQSRRRKCAERPGNTAKAQVSSRGRTCAHVHKTGVRHGRITSSWHARRAQLDPPRWPAQQGQTCTTMQSFDPHAVPGNSFHHAPGYHVAELSEEGVAARDPSTPLSEDDLKLNKYLGSAQQKSEWRAQMPQALKHPHKTTGSSRGGAALPHSLDEAPPIARVVRKPIQALWSCRGSLSNGLPAGKVWTVCGGRT